MSTERVLAEFMVEMHTRLHQLQQSQERVVRMSVDGLPVYQYLSASSQHPLQVSC
jgi:hypothetical protein